VRGWCGHERGRGRRARWPAITAVIAAAFPCEREGGARVGDDGS
jgi:hypothetical protein